MGKLSEKQKPGAIVGKTYTVTCIPSVKMANSFANLGYNNYTALKDIIDNSIDAMAKNVTVNIGWYKEGPKKHIDSIEIHDDGRGMSMLTLQQALTYGSNTSHAQDDLGCFACLQQKLILVCFEVYNVYEKIPLNHQHMFVYHP